MIRGPGDLNRPGLGDIFAFIDLKTSSLTVAATVTLLPEITDVFSLFGSCYKYLELLFLFITIL